MQRTAQSIIVSMTFILLISFLGSGCSMRPMVVGKPSTGEIAYPYTSWSPNKRVCILPFENLTKDTDADITVREIFLTELFGAHIFNDIVDLVEANAALMSLRIRKPDSLDKETIRAIGEKLNVSYLILGVVSDYGFGKHKDSGARVTISVRMIDVETGNIMWAANHFKKGDNSLSRIFGISEGPTPIELAREACSEIVDALKDNISKSAYNREPIVEPSSEEPSSEEPSPSPQEENITQEDTLYR
ncbi:MAG: hypothetical protein ACMUJM_08415 [bacterium]